MVAPLADVPAVPLAYPPTPCPNIPLSKAERQAKYHVVHDDNEAIIDPRLTEADYVSPGSAWVAGILYTEIPRAPLQPIKFYYRDFPNQKHRRFYGITRGEAFGITTNPELALRVTSGRAGCTMPSYSSQSDALGWFNQELAADRVKRVGRSDPGRNRTIIVVNSKYGNAVALALVAAIVGLLYHTFK